MVDTVLLDENSHVLRVVVSSFRCAFSFHNFQFSCETFQIPVENINASGTS